MPYLILIISFFGILIYFFSKRKWLKLVNFL
jgi:hypothetical protein